jgi:hypothetical protein
MGPIVCQEMLVRNYHSTLLNIPEECWFHVHRDRSPKSCKKKSIFILRKIYKKWSLTNKWQFNTLPTRWPFNSIPSFPIHFTHFRCSMPDYILTYSLTVYMILLNSVLKKLRIESLAGPNGELIHKPRPFVKRNTGFTNVSSFTSLRMCSMYFTWSCIYFFLPSLPATILSSLCLVKSPKSLPGVSSLGPLGVVCFFGHCSSSKLELIDWLIYFTFRQIFTDIEAVIVIHMST